MHLFLYLGDGVSRFWSLPSCARMVARVHAESTQIHTAG